MTTSAHQRKAPDPLEKLYERGACQGTRCKGAASIEWVKTRNGKPVPLDRGRDPLGPIVLDKGSDGKWIARAFRAGDDPNRPRYTVHWSSCPTPNLYARAKQAADPAGELPPLAPSSQHSGPCAKCGDIHDHHYGPLSEGPLCPQCAEEARARWSPAFRRAQGLPDLIGAG